MTDNMNKSIDNEELDLDQLENVSGGALNGAAAVNGAAAANALLVHRMTNEAGIRSSMNSTPQALLLNSDKMLDDKK